MWREDALYEEWKIASEEQRRPLEDRLCAAIKQHAETVVWTKLHENNPDLVQEIISAAVHGMGIFREQSQFSTWVEAIARNKVKQKLRARTRRRKVFDENAQLEEEKLLAGLEPDFHSSIELSWLSRGLNRRERQVLQCMVEGLDQRDIAKRLGISPDAAEGARRRLRQKLQKKFSRNGG